jgi:hypothetical protein
MASYVFASDYLFLWSPYFWAAVIGIPAGILGIFVAITEDVAGAFWRRKMRRQRVERARETGGQVAADQEVAKQHAEAVAARVHTKNAIVEGITGSDKVDQVKFKIFVAVVAALVILAIVQSV